MGATKLFSSSSYDPESSPANGKAASQKSHNPDPRRYTVKRIHKKDDFLILRVNYPDCKNYEGNKILVFRGCTMVDLAKQGSIDPHFSANKDFHSPIARFKPDDEGWKMAEFFVENFR